MDKITQGTWEAVCVGDTGSATPLDIYAVQSSQGKTLVCEFVMEADARLIAAAPELLEAAKQYLKACPADQDTTLVFEAASLALQAAIAKAESKQ